MNYVNKYLSAWMLILLSSTHVFSQANTGLSNLVGTNINQSLRPNENNTLDLGYSSPSWKNLYLDGSIYLDDVKIINNDNQSLFVGAYSGISNTGTNNTAIGKYSLNKNTTGVKNTASGYASLYFNTTGNYNTSNGYYSLYSNTTGNYNAAFGYKSLQSNTTGYSNTSVGASALYNNTIGYANTATGYSALYSNTTGVNNTAHGYLALFSNTTGVDNTANGGFALYNNTTGDYNTASGNEALYSNTSGDNNTAIGLGALKSNTIGFGNTATGVSALHQNTSGYYNTAYGDVALYSNTFGIYNTAIGKEALGSNTTGSGNTANGNYALVNSTTGNYNTAIGYAAGYTNDHSTNCTFIGSDADQSDSAYVNNSTAIGSSSKVTASDQVRFGNTFVTSIGGYVPWTDLSDSRFKKEIRENVPGMAFINKLNPVTYHLDVTGLRKFLGEEPERIHEDLVENSKHKASIEQGISKKEQIVYTGFIAQEVEEAAKEISYDFSGVDVPQNEQSLYGLRYSQFVVPLVKAVQELDISQKSEAGNRQSEIDELKKEIEDLKSQIALLESSIGSARAIFPPSGESEGGLLGQNIPNPFDHSTIIPFRIPKDCNDASMVISESSTGKIVKVIPVACSETQLTLEAGLLSSGTYSYSLMVDGRIIDSKQMELIK